MSSGRPDQRRHGSWGDAMRSFGMVSPAMAGTVLAGVLLVAAAACAPTHIRQEQAYDGPALPRPDNILVADFAVTPQEVRLDSGLRARLMSAVSGTAPDAQAAEDGRAVAGAISSTLVQEIQKLGLPAVRADASAPAIGGNTLIIDGQMLSVDEGNRTRRNLIGLGAGQSTVEADLQLYYQSSGSQPRLIESFEAVAQSSRKPGAAETMGVGAATGRVAESAAMGAGTSLLVSGDATSDGERMAQQVVQKLKPFFTRQGWLTKPST